MKELTPILENYLETIYNLSRDKNHKSAIRITDIAEELGRSKASVNTAIKSLVELGHLKHEHYGDIELTQSGTDIGRDLAERHAIFFHFLTNVLGVEEELADKEACLIEHTMSKDTVNKFKAFLCSFCKSHMMNK